MGRSELFPSLPKDQDTPHRLSVQVVGRDARHVVVSNRSFGASNVMQALVLHKFASLHNTNFVGELLANVPASAHQLSSS